jgi:hypothetical protein
MFYAASHGCILEIDPLHLLENVESMSKTICLAPVTWANTTCNIGNYSVELDSFGMSTRLPKGPFEEGSADSALRLLMGFNSTHALGKPCPSVDPNSLAIKVRSGDIMAGHWENNRWISDWVHPGYGQPPLGFYLAVLNLRAWSSVTILCEDSNNPVCPVLSQLSVMSRFNVTVLYDVPLDAVIETMACAPAIANGEGSMRLLWHSSEILQEEFSFTDEGCRTYSADHKRYKIWTDNNVVGENWHNSELQRSRMLCPADFKIDTCKSKPSLSGGCGPGGCARS